MLSSRCSARARLSTWTQPCMADSSECMAKATANSLKKTHPWSAASSLRRALSKTHVAGKERRFSQPTLRPEVLATAPTPYTFGVLDRGARAAEDGPAVPSCHNLKIRRKPTSCQSLTYRCLNCWPHGNPWSRYPPKVPDPLQSGGTNIMFVP